MSALLAFLNQLINKNHSVQVEITDTLKYTLAKEVVLHIQPLIMQRDGRHMLYPRYAIEGGSTSFHHFHCTIVYFCVYYVSFKIYMELPEYLIWGII